MTYGYLLAKEERDGKNYKYRPSEPKLNFYRSSGKIATLLILNEKVNEITYGLNDRKSFEEMRDMSFFNVDLKIEEMKKSSSEILREQSIIAGVSNWECYFLDVCEIILNDDDFIKLLYSDKNKLKKFLNSFRLMQDLQTEFFLNENKITGLEFGTYIIVKRKLNFKDLEIVKDFFKKLVDIDLVKIDPTNWTEIDTFIKDRHEFIHNSNNQKIITNYSTDKIKHIIKNMSNIINNVDEILFTDHHPLLPLSSFKRKSSK